MHIEAHINFIIFLYRHVVPLYRDVDTLSFVDIGSYNVNGSLLDIISSEFAKGNIKKFDYVGVDESPGPNVDVVCNAHDLSSLGYDKFDIVLSSSSFEHDPQFWRTFKEMSKVCKPGGLIYINAPSTGMYHGYPGDCYRFYKDAWQALCDYVNKKGAVLELIETYVDPNGNFQDSIGIYRKLEKTPDTLAESLSHPGEPQI